MTSEGITTVDIRTGDCLEILRTLEAESVNCCVTSPPYWGLRDYGTGTWEGGDPECDHKNPAIGKPTWGPGSTGSSTLRGKPTNDSHSREGFKGCECPRCGARRIDSQLGLEPTPEEYVGRMVEVFREVRRVLREDGTMWLNLGDSYAGSWGAQSRGENSQLANRSVSSQQILAAPQRVNTGSWVAAHPTIKPKDLIGIPWMVAFALRTDGWYLRSDIIWHKPNPMPESVTDRPTKSHEYLFLLSKSQRYYYDAEAIEESVTDATLDRYKSGYNGFMSRVQQASPVDTRTQGMDSAATHLTKTRNKRSVWTIPTQPYPKAHFATFPEKLVEPCILAGCPEEGTVLDPFLGSGTTALVAHRLGRNCIGIELNPEYVALAEERFQQKRLFT